MGTCEELLVGQRPLPIPHRWLLCLPGCEVGGAYFCKYVENLNFFVSFGGVVF